MAGNKFANLELKVGLFVIISIALMAAIILTFAIKKKLFMPKINVSILTDSGDGITKSMPVKYAGFTISRVYEVELMDDGNVVLHTRIPKQYTKWIRQDSVAKLTSQNIIGSSFIVFSGGSANSLEITDGTSFNLTREGGLAALMEQAQPVIEDIKEIVNNVANITQTIEDQSENINRFFGGLGDVGDDLHNKTGSVGYLVRSDYIKDEVKNIVGRIEVLQMQLNEIADNVNLKVERTDESIDKLNSALQAFKEGVQSIEKAVESAQPTIDNANKISGDVAEATDNITEIKNQADSILKTSDRILYNLEQRWPFNDGSVITGEKVKLP
ncbi:MAG: MlaD family protein [Geovibrio sp.]|jgi:phospholipid/cholesterol/gamma-HCH transport system substrate-binding protein|uniref:MlaD family protein n=1 Tax=Geovibrio ferrireducens TaxID=46201 RepID=UPI0022464C2A|nr:MlaD family protein [Geovibrio ferrireducens]MCD8491096.1 MlaD family protein [Geovibrio sp.]